MNLKTLWREYPDAMRRFTIETAVNAAREAIRRKTQAAPNPTKWTPPKPQDDARSDAQLLKDALGWEDSHE